MEQFLIISSSQKPTQIVLFPFIYLYIIHTWIVRRHKLHFSNYFRNYQGTKSGKL